MKDSVPYNCFPCCYFCRHFWWFFPWSFSLYLGLLSFSALCCSWVVDVSQEYVCSFPSEKAFQSVLVSSCWLSLSPLFLRLCISLSVSANWRCPDARARPRPLISTSSSCLKETLHLPRLILSPSYCTCPWASSIPHTAPYCSSERTTAKSCICCSHTRSISPILRSAMPSFCNFFS